ncbi:hypothetical protein K7X08_010128 [Anisodus acutangulus]|uniref:CST complex subunit STN1 n=1 Tax=Anisodus acutangulus TaxID=402998 RepID=A0A9Q1N0J4_9SOLA|nr:hypothetical protein K7X08_010128 [Anisodus acutangulus]
MDSLQLLNTHDPTSFYRKGTRLSRAETVGIIVSRDYKPNVFLKFDIDYGTGCIPWLNQETSHHFSRRCSSEMATDFASQVQLGVIARVRGRITSYRGMLSLTRAG